MCDLILNGKADNTCLYADNLSFLNASYNKNEAKVKTMVILYFAEM